MNYSDLNNKLKTLDIEDFIWVIYIGIIILSWYSNSLERNYYQTNNINSKNKYQNIMIIIFTILLIVYSYFLKSSYDDLKNNQDNNLVIISFIASLLIFISGLLYLYIAITDENLSVEIAFN